MASGFTGDSIEDLRYPKSRLAAVRYINTSRYAKWNKRRSELIDKKIDDTLTEEEREEFNILQEWSRHVTNTAYPRPSLPNGLDILTGMSGEPWFMGTRVDESGKDRC